MLLHCELGTTVGLRASLFKHGQIEDIPFDVMYEDELWTEFIHARLECNLEVICSEDEKSVRTSMQNLRKHVRPMRRCLCCVVQILIDNGPNLVVGVGQDWF